MTHEKTNKQLIRQLREAVKPPKKRHHYLSPKGLHRANLWFALHCAGVERPKSSLGIEDEIARCVHAAKRRIEELQAAEPKLIRIPIKFCLDHDERSLPTPEIVRGTKSHWFIRADDPALPELLNDAEFYADPFGPDADYLGGLKASARATIRAIRDVIGWDDASTTVQRLKRPVA